MTYSKVLCIGDIHFKNTSLIPYYNQVDENGITRELRKAIDSINWTAEVITKEKPDLVIQLGDIFHTLLQGEYIVIKEAVKSIQSLHSTCRDLGIPFYILGGNHDLIKNGEFITEILSCDRHFSETETIEFNNLKLAFIPYIDPEYKMHYQIQTIEADIVFTHTTLKNAYYNRVRKSKEGLDLNLIDKYVISGHIHIPQDFGKFYYTGSLYQNSFAEEPINENLQQGLTLIEIKDGKITTKQIPNPVVDKLITIRESNFCEKISQLEDDRFFIRLYTNNQELIDELKEYTDKFIVLPEKTEKNKVAKEYHLDESLLNTAEVISDYISSNYPYLKEYVKRYLTDK